MFSAIKNRIKQHPPLYYLLSMGLGPFIRFSYFKRFIRQFHFDTENKKVLDAGFGRGEHLHWLEQQNPNLQLVGYDLAETTTYLSNIASYSTLNIIWQVCDLRIKPCLCCFQPIPRIIQNPNHKIDRS